MADTKAPAAAPAAAPALPPMTTEQQLALALTALAASNTKVVELMEAQTAFNEFQKRNAVRRRKTMAEYLRQKPRKRLLHETFQNGRLINPSGLSLETIQKLDTLATGTYADGLVQIVRISDGPQGLNSRIHVFYNNRTPEQRMVFSMRFPTFTHLVNTVAAEMASRNIAPVNDPAPDPVVPEFPDEL
jgi:hypothetical protein